MSSRRWTWVVRVVGNDAVHPGALDLRDDRAAAERLFGLVNLIVERMISYPKHVEALDGSLPETKRDEIERRKTPRRRNQSSAVVCCKGRARQSQTFVRGLSGAEPMGDTAGP